MSNLEMVSFMYPSLNRSNEALSVPVAPQPEILFHGLELGKTYPLDITVGMCMDASKKYMISIDVFFDGESVLDGNNSIKKSGATIFYSTEYPGHTTFINTLPLTAVKIPNSGAYKVVLSLYESSEINKLDRLVAQNECHFIVTP